MIAKTNVDVMLEIFSAIERRDSQRLLELFHPDVKLHWPPSLPYGGTSRGLKPRKSKLQRNVGPSATYRG